MRLRAASDQEKRTKGDGQRTHAEVDSNPLVADLGIHKAA